MTDSRLWTSAELEYFDLLYPDFPAKWVAALMGKPIHAIKNMVKVRKPKKSDWYYQMVRERRFIGEKFLHIAKEPEQGIRHVDFRGFLVERYVREDGRIDYRPASHIVWEAYNGTIPKGHSISYRDGDKTNVDIENLILVSYKDRMEMNSVHRLPPEIKEVINVKKAIKAIIRSREREQQHEQTERTPIRSAGQAQEFNE